MANTSLIVYEQVPLASVIFKRFDYVKLICDIIFCVVNIFKILIYKV